MLKLVLHIELACVSLINASVILVSGGESRIAPAPVPAQAAPKRQHLYEQSGNPVPAQLPPLTATLTRIPSESNPHYPQFRNGSIQSDDPLRGIYTLPSSDPENPSATSSKPNKKPGNFNYFSGKLVSNILAVMQIGLILLFAIFVRYEEETVNAIPKSYVESKKPTQRPNFDDNFYNTDPNRDRDHNNNLYESNINNEADTEDSRYGGGSGRPGFGPRPGPQFQPVTREPTESQISTGYYPTQNLQQFYYCKLAIHLC